MPALWASHVVSQSKALVEHYHRQPDGSWRYLALGVEGSVQLSHGIELGVEALYDGVFAIPGE